MSCIQVTACQSACLPAVNIRNMYQLRGTPSMLRITPTWINQFPKTSLKLAPMKSTYHRRAPVCLYGDKGKSENISEASSPWEALEKAMGSLKKEPSVEDLLKQQMEKKEYYDDGGSGGGGNRRGGGGGGGASGESEDEGFAGITDEVLQVIFATIGFVFLYIFIIDGEDITRLAKDFIKFLFTRKKSIRLRRVMEDWGGFFQRLTRKKEVQENWLESAIINTPTAYDSPEKYRRVIRSYMARTKSSDPDPDPESDPDDDY